MQITDFATFEEGRQSARCRSLRMQTSGIDVQFSQQGLRPDHSMFQMRLRRHPRDCLSRTMRRSAGARGLAAVVKGPTRNNIRQAEPANPPGGIGGTARHVQVPSRSAVRPSIQARTSSSRQATTRWPSLTGSGNSPRAISSYIVLRRKVVRASTCGRRKSFGDSAMSLSFHVERDQNMPDGAGPVRRDLYVTGIFGTLFGYSSLTDGICLIGSGSTASRNTIQHRARAEPGHNSSRCSPSATCSSSDEGCSDEAVSALLKPHTARRPSDSTCSM